jgi:2-polyprenyl-3-methyl-5-hydroxy-6-metoxy-1,4-benzoquinol methylase
MTDVPDEIVHHYRSFDEDARIRQGYGQLELLRTQEIVRNYLRGFRNGRGLHIVDIGGATGVHASWLAEDGHRIQIFDVVPEHVETAQSRAAATPAIEAAWGDARQLPSPDHSFDVALLFGPLYHLTARPGRLRALQEAIRVVRPGGLIFIAAISRFASLFDGLSRGFLFDAEFRHMVETDLADGQHRNPGQHPGWFTTAYFHRPEELEGECRDAGLDVVAIHGVEGLAGWLPQLAERWETPSYREVILQAARAIEKEDSLLGLSAHYIAVTQTPP